MGYIENFDFWNDTLTSDEDKSALSTLYTDENLCSDSFYRFLEFGTAGMRGVLGIGTNRMNLYTVRRATIGVAKYLIEIGEQERGVAIAYDSRNRSAEFALDTALMLAKFGIKVYLYDTLKSVPQLSFAILTLKTAAGIVITASHNPPQYNGYKLYGEDGAQMGPEAAAKVTEYINAVDDYLTSEPMSEKYAQQAGLLAYIGADMDERYYAKVRELQLDPKATDEFGKTLKLVYTPLYGSGNVPVRRLLSDIGVTNVGIVTEQELPNGDFPTVKAPNPEERDAFTLAMKLADATGAGFILATDPDSDRLGVAIKTGEGYQILSGNQIGCLLLDYICTMKHANFVGDEFAVKSIVSTDMAKKITDHYGVELRDVPTGFKFIGEQIEISEKTGKGTFIFGFEESYGFLAGSYCRDKDAAAAAMLFADMACHYARGGKTVTGVLEDLYKEYGYFKENVFSLTLAGAEGIAKIKGAMMALRDDVPTDFSGHCVVECADYLSGTKAINGVTEPTDFQKTDMLIFKLTDGKVIMRPSGTEPKLKCYISTSDTDEARATAVAAELEAACRGLLGRLTT